jgi:hypothetical protein
MDGTHSSIRRFRDRRAMGSSVLAFVLMRTLTWTSGVAAAVDASPASVVAADDPNSGEWLPLGLQSYEPSAFGYTKNNDDVGFYNIKLSVKFPLMPRLTNRWFGTNDRLYFAFTGAFGFYIGSRDSGPVVGKEYNPQLFWQHQRNGSGASRGIG